MLRMHQNAEPEMPLIDELRAYVKPFDYVRIGRTKGIVSGMHERGDGEEVTISVIGKGGCMFAPCVEYLAHVKLDRRCLHRIVESGDIDAEAIRSCYASVFPTLCDGQEIDKDDIPNLPVGALVDVEWRRCSYGYEAQQDERDDTKVISNAVIIGWDRQRSVNFDGTVVIKPSIEFVSPYVIESDYTGLTDTEKATLVNRQMGESQLLDEAIGTHFSLSTHEIVSMRVRKIVDDNVSAIIAGISASQLMRWHNDALYGQALCSKRLATMVSVPPRTDEDVLLGTFDTKEQRELHEAMEHYRNECNVLEDESNRLINYLQPDLIRS